MKTKMKRLCVDVLIDLGQRVLPYGGDLQLRGSCRIPHDRYFRNRHDPVPASGNAHRHDERSAEYSDCAVLLQNSWKNGFI